MWGGKLAAIKGTRGSTRSEEEGTKIKREGEELSRDYSYFYYYHYYYSMIAYKDYIFYSFVVIKSVLFPSHSHFIYATFIYSDSRNRDRKYRHIIIMCTCVYLKSE